MYLRTGRAGGVAGVPVRRHHADELLFDIALAVEREMPWPKVAPELGARRDERFEEREVFGPVA